MRKLIVSILLVAFALPALAKCASTAIWAYPSTKEVPRNGRFLVIGYGKAVQVIDSLDESYPVHLQSGDRKVPLKVEERNKGYKQKQALIRPKEELEPGRTYRLRIPSLGDRESVLLTNYRSELDKREWLSWKVGKKRDQKMPEWKQTPELVDRRYQELGCGPRVQAVFGLEGIEDAELWAKVRLRKVGSELNEEWILPIEDGQVVLGHGMCSGSFSFAPSSKYEVRFRLMDPCGNKMSTWSEWKRFEAPEKGSP